MPDSGSLTRPAPLRLRCANHLLQQLSAQDAGLLRPALEPVQLDVGRVLYAPGQPVRQVYFVESGLVSIVGANKGRRRMEVGMVGFEGMTSLETVLGGGVAAHEALVQSPGSALRLSSAALHELEGKRLIRSVRNRVRIIDRTGLERTANGFYGAPEDEYRRLFGEDLRHHQAG